uniref:Uncharacterized protein n=1 Tax=Arundo donax TaxID=35708 RepID=A0A0A9G7F0_ARUDO
MCFINSVVSHRAFLLLCYCCVAYHSIFRLKSVV